jgi:hypothetical protein
LIVLALVRESSQIFAMHECATSYSDEGAHANDKLDDALNAVLEDDGSGGGAGALQGGGVGLEFVHAHPSERSEGREPGVLRSNTETLESVRLSGTGHLLSPVGKAGDPCDLIVFYHERGGKHKYLDFEIKLREGHPGAVALTYTLCTTGDGAAVRDQGVLTAVGQNEMPLASPLVLKPGEAVHVLLRIDQVSARHQGRPYLVRFAARAAEQGAATAASSAAAASSASSAPQVDPLQHALLQLAIAHGPWLPSATGGFSCPACQITHDTAEHNRAHNLGCVLAGALAVEASSTATPLLEQHTLESDPILVLSKPAGSPRQAAGGPPQQAAVGSSGGGGGGGGGGGVSGSGERKPQHRSPAKSPRKKKAALGTRGASADNINDGESMTDRLAAALCPISPMPFTRAAGAGDGGGAWSTPLLMGLQQTMLSHSSSDDSNEKS